ncbi:MAG: tRNA lysidine(34) synthetase TilS [Thermoleophilaceae bacterium]|nr:tRNA lysidine(34) synthetase TilS [Thermoleophilaceae bacterium]
MDQRKASANEIEVERVVREALVSLGADPAENPAIVMLSGGGDSTALLLAMARIYAPGQLIALHVNYGLRGLQSEADEDFCRDLCARFSVPIEVRRAPAHKGGNLQDWARDLRYAAAEEMAQPRGEDAVVAVAHSADDQAETILYRLFASPGRRALQGMSARRGRIVRPMLNLRRAELRGWLVGQGEIWREDATNEDDRFARVKARRLLADAEALHPAAINNLLQTAEDLRVEGAELGEVVDGLTAGLTTDDGALDLDGLAELPPALGGAVLRRYVEERRPVPVPKAARVLDEALRLGRSGELRELQVEGARLAIQRGRARVLH